MSRDWKVLLFTESGVARPRFLARWVALPEGITNVYTMLTCNQRRAFDDADRWWLVSCRDASDGRTCIEASVNAVKYGPEAMVHIEFWTGVAQRHGRILAHGSREPREAAK